MTSVKAKVAATVDACRSSGLQLPLSFAHWPVLHHLHYHAMRASWQHVHIQCVHKLVPQAGSM
jgi:hypothetical protein